jgi:hypothetical protein
MMHVTTTNEDACAEPAQAAEGALPLRSAAESREALSRSVLGTLAADFARGGKAAIEAVRTQDPTTYLKLCLQLVSRQDGPADPPLGAMSDAELAYLEAVLAAHRAPKEDGR